ncbi:MAG: DNA mismatch endonuclease Vsr [Bacteroidetes bacterium]|jgi:DNA mismatch endonuclease, patch repair protein|nr:DNA mismatch endonuclease Vsr [Bacteroidota bacterium]MBT5528563.1 DNA mismatch endonuclease Vsr [Cytophagia bacterium]
MDKLTKEKRSWNMSKIRSGNTKPELLVRSLLHRMGYRFRLHQKDLPGKPDVVLAKHKAVIFIHGCFWHHHKGCKYAYIPKTRKEFWEAKFKSNIERDKKVNKLLKEKNWRILIIWECEISNIELTRKKLKDYLIIDNTLGPFKDIVHPLRPGCEVGNKQLSDMNTIIKPVRNKLQDS